MIAQKRLPGMAMPVEYEVAWLTPPETMSYLEGRFGKFDFDPCPYPRPDGFDGLIMEWGRNNYVNPPFKYGQNGLIAWVKKALLEFDKGKNVVLVWPMPTWFDLLIQKNCRIESLGVVPWVSSDGGRQ